MANKYDLKDISSIPKKPVFFDANVLIYIFWPIGGSKWAYQYSGVFKDLMKNNYEMAIDVTIVSEVVNRIFRIEYSKHLERRNLNNRDFPFKKYRDSSDGQEVINDIRSIFNKKILPKFNIFGKAFTKEDITGFLNENSMDFSDKIICSLCKENDCILLTNDRDYASADVDILTSNPGLLR